MSEDPKKELLITYIVFIITFIILTIIVGAKVKGL